MAKEYTKEELLQILKDNVNEDGLIPMEVIANLTFDVKFPDKLVNNAVKVLNEARDITRRQKELRVALLEKYEASHALQVRITHLIDDFPRNSDEIFALKVQQKAIQKEIEPLAKGLEVIEKTLKQYRGQK